MSDALFSMSFDQNSLSEIAQFAGFGVFLTDEMGQAMQDAGTLLQKAAVANTWEVFSHPSGQLADSIGVILDSPFEVQIGVGVSYGRRREYGFSGMTDSLGRHFTNDPAKPYLQPARDDNQQAVLQRIDQAVQASLERMGVSF